MLARFGASPISVMISNLLTTALVIMMIVGKHGVRLEGHGHPGVQGPHGPPPGHLFRGVGQIKQRVIDGTFSHHHSTTIISCTGRGTGSPQKHIRRTGCHDGGSDVIGLDGRVPVGVGGGVHGETLFLELGF